MRDLFIRARRAAQSLFVLLAFSPAAPAAGEGLLPALDSYRFLAPDTLPDGSPRPLRAGDTIEIFSRWVVPDSAALADSLTVTADFSQLEPGVGGNDAVRARREPGGIYRAVYTLGLAESRSDTSGIQIPLTATGPTGTHTDRRIEVCLSNHPPLHRLTSILNPKGAAYRTGDSLVIETVWATRFRSPLRLTADFSQIVADTAEARPRVVRLGESVYRIFWRLPFDRELMLPDGSGKHVPILARDAGCGETWSDVLLPLDIDTEPPDPAALFLDPLPTVTTAESLRVAGRAPGAVVVLVFRDLSVKGIAEVDSLTGAFSATIALAQDENRIQIKAEDLAGNPTPLYPSTPVLVTRVAGAVLQVSAPYSREDRIGVTSDDIRLRDPSGMEDARVRIFNLEGDCLWEQAFGPGKVMERVFHWPGRDRSGARAPQGYYLVRGEWRDGGGRARSLTQGLLLRD